jgi:hypothetical protein
VRMFEHLVSDVIHAIVLGCNPCSVCGKTTRDTNISKKKFADKYCSKKCRYARSASARYAAYHNRLETSRAAGSQVMSYQALSTALNVSLARISQLAKAGMPMNSIESARKWREENKGKRCPKSSSTRIADSNAELTVELAVGQNFTHAENADPLEDALDGAFIEAEHFGVLVPNDVDSEEEPLSSLADRILRRNTN